MSFCLMYSISIPDVKKNVLPYSNMCLFFSEESNCKDTNNPGPSKKNLSTKNVFVKIGDGVY